MGLRLARDNLSTVLLLHLCGEVLIGAPSPVSATSAAENNDGMAIPGFPSSWRDLLLPSAIPPAPSASASETSPFSKFSSSPPFSLARSTTIPPLSPPATSASPPTDSTTEDTSATDEEPKLPFFLQPFSPTPRSETPTVDTPARLSPSASGSRQPAPPAEEPASLATRGLPSSNAGASSPAPRDAQDDTKDAEATTASGFWRLPYPDTADSGDSSLSPSSPPSSSAAPWPWPFSRPPLSASTGQMAVRKPQTLMDQYGWILGILACLVGSFCGSLGDNMIRKSFLVLKDDVQLYHMWRSPLWTVGMFLTVVVNTLCTLIALVFTPATIVTSFAGVHIFWNTILAKTLNHEQTVWYDYAGVTAITVGITLIVACSGKDRTIDSIESFVGNLGCASSACFCLVLFVLICFGSTITLAPTLLGLPPASCTADSCSRSAGEDEGRSLSPPGQHASHGNSLSVSLEGAEEFCVDIRRARVIERFAVAATSGACGGLSNLFAKAVLLLGNATASPGGVDEAKEALGGTLRYDWTAGSLVVIVAVVSVMQIVFLSTSLRRFEAIYVVPTINSVLIASGAIGGVILFEEVPRDAPLFALGLVLVVSGVTALSYGKYEAEKQKVAEDLRLQAAQGNSNAEPLLPTHERSRFSSLLGFGASFFEGGRACDGCCDTLFRPLTSASVNILVRNNTMNAHYPSTLLGPATCEGNASLKVLRHASMEVRAAMSEANESGGVYSREESPARQR
ncbi:hypothetical protein BESB_075340 [Besnoitia besnoiti]|uniref:Magnesium transporter NIPA n=1 Tax=Besnoitia besnoiti TaxID=94643 RepID=A0A2A9MG77_BESBE|nr:uncharacterized protein BESB_075340 [Besnoitia besnoiti]PFH34382.1 hypothetical protein BESB_075340 [Besnoitia besnoiti]